MTKKAVLVIIDGYGINEQKIKGDAIADSNSTWIPLLSRKYPTFEVYAHGPYVGLGEGQMGNSEVGHLTIGAGMVLPQDVMRINNEMASGEFKGRLLNLVGKYEKERIHIFGMLSNGGVHSHIDHIKQILRDLPNKEIWLHIVSDGRDTAPSNFLIYYEELMQTISELGRGRIATLGGRYYGMDRDKRMERIEAAYLAMTQGNPTSQSVEEYVQGQYAKKISDEFIEPVLFNAEGIIREGEPIIFPNYRSDRMKQILTKFEFRNPCYTMTQYTKGQNATVIFDKLVVKDTLSIAISNAGRTQCHVAETEKYAHVTYFLNGGSEEPVPLEKRIMIPSPKVASYDLCPEMSTSEIASSVIKCMYEEIDFIVCNIAAPDMVGHTGFYEETKLAVIATDIAIGLIYEACKKTGYALFVTSDHGNAEVMLDSKGNPSKKHTVNRVPFICCTGSAKCKAIKKGSLIDVAPTVLAYLGIEKPEKMTGVDLLADY